MTAGDAGAGLGLRMRVLARAALLLGLLGVAGRARAVSAANDCVRVSAPSPAVYVEVDGDRFDVYACRTDASSGGEVYVSAMSGWSLASSPALLMRGGDSSRYALRRPPEDTRSGTVFYHEYRISSNRGNGDSRVTVPFGQNVIYTSRMDGGSRKSDWLVNGQRKRQTSGIVFNRNWWNVPSWFIPSVDTVRPDSYSVDAHDSERSLLRDLGRMVVVGVAQGLNYRTDDAFSDVVEGTLYVRKGSLLTFQAFPDPDAVEWPEGTPAWTGATPQADSRDVAAVDTSQARELEVSASCGKSRVTMPVVVYECRFSLYVQSPSDDAPISFTWTPSSSGSFSPNVGHTSWKLEISPDAAKRLVESCYDSDVLRYVNVCVGYYPENAVDSTGRAPGFLKLNDKSAGVSKAYEVTPSQFLKGLDATYMTAASPGTYVLGTRLYLAKFYDDGSVTEIADCTNPSDRNCTTVCLDVMSEMGLPMLSAATQWSGDTNDYYIIFEGNSPFKLAESIRNEE